MLLHFILLMLHLMLLHLLMLHLVILVTSSVLCPSFVDAIYPVCTCALVQAAQCVGSLSRKVWGWFTAWKCTLPKLGEPSVKDTLDILSLQIKKIFRTHYHRDLIANYHRDLGDFADLDRACPSTVTDSLSYQATKKLRIFMHFARGALYKTPSCFCKTSTNINGMACHGKDLGKILETLKLWVSLEKWGFWGNALNIAIEKYFHCTN